MLISKVVLVVGVFVHCEDCTSYDVDHGSHTVLSTLFVERLPPLGISDPEIS